MYVNLSRKIFKQFITSLNLYHSYGEKYKKNPESKPSGFRAISIV